MKFMNLSFVAPPASQKDLRWISTFKKDIQGHRINTRNNKGYRQNGAYYIESEMRYLLHLSTKFSSKISDFKSKEEM